MNTVTKVFIVLNLIIALVAGAVVATMYAYQENYKRRWDKDTKELADDLKRVSKSNLELSLARTTAINGLRQANSKISELQARKQELEGELEADKATIANKETTISELTVINQKQQARIDQLTDSLRISEKRRAELNSIAHVARAVAFQLNVKLAEVEDDLNHTTAELTRRERTIYELEEEAKRKDALLAIVRTDFPKVYKHMVGRGETVSGTVINAVVAAVKVNVQGQQDLVMLTIGRDDEVREGMEFIIYQENQYIVKVRAERVLSDMVACRVLPDSWNAKQLKIAPGQLATNRLF